ncbi:MAG TPA: NAD(P)-dependent glycerol-3-phosphate dehydrogenase [Aquifex aeolicus]|uniref:Glycerol-3-phosphate dehydrogenase [NAD(P)+] n=1 Tax=Aquifex aeolicus TaxID=63363 RepID=A0A9D0YQM6_AQUAO|nr:NAD(P)-dependent glycerol-3-phosphate dehydrogenase [Aquificales bacterium]HIP98360.1 NAD(P)-dependent glycerol-3-phosphate dehydrogenase [Aquifex aeolicus]HIQ26303.1 NAD(P)-dependent glycerol-3-phosphate dehydrogenase [Aquifex aeolicus]
MRLGIVGGGAWGCALAHVFSQNHEVLVFDRDPQKVKLINSSIYPADRTLKIDRRVRATESLDELLEFAEVIFISVPTQAVREVLKNFPPEFNKPVINTAKGVEIKSFKTLSEVVSEILPRAEYFVLSGPSFAREVVCGKPTAVVLAGFNHELGKELQKTLNVPKFRIYWNDDVKGVELGGALKNVMAIAVGICDGMEMGHNARSALITRGLKEMAFLGENLGAKRETFYGLSGLGDLVLTATGDLSRNRRFGLAIGRGKKIPHALREIGTVEGYHTVKAVFNLSQKMGLELPITETVYRVLYENFPLEEAMKNLLNRTPKEE